MATGARDDDRASGELRYGWQAALVRTFFGQGANRGGWNRQKALAVAAYLRKNPPSSETAILLLPMTPRWVSR
jgi:hypothetical protein